MAKDTLISFDNLERVLKEYGQLVQDLYKIALTDSDRRASNELINSVRYIYTSGSNKWEISLNLQDYWYYVEYGRRPGKFPPVDKILEWIRVKPILPYPDSNGKLPTEKQLAFLIGRKISEEGYEGSHDLERTLEMVNAEYEEKIMEALDKDLDEGFGLILHQTFKK